MNFFQKHILEPISIAPLVTFRVLFGFIMAISIVRFWYKGWIYDLYIAPKYYFTYLGFDWVKPLGEYGMYLVFFMLFLAAIGIMVGAFYKFNASLFFVLFTYVELIDKTNYLNHYYFVSLVAFLLILVPAQRYFSIDSWRDSSIKNTKVPAWTINIFKLQLGFVYFFAGIAKLNHEWLINAMPLKLWLPAVSDTFLIGFLFNYDFVPYLFSWTGAFYDLTIVFFLLYNRTRIWAYLVVILFHVMTAMLFQIGMFPYIMILSTLIYFSANFHEKIIEKVQELFKIQPTKIIQENVQSSKYLLIGLALFFMVQIILPFRYLLYSGDLYWHEQGYRFSWRVMLMEKAGYTTFIVMDESSEKKEFVDNYEYLTVQQEKMMSTQPDMILQFAHFLAKEYKKKGFDNPIVNCKSKVTLNGSKSQLFVNENIDLAKEERGFEHKNWVIPFNEEQQ